MRSRSLSHRWKWSHATSPVSPFQTLPGVWEKVSQMEGPRPSSSKAPSTWYDAVAEPNVKPGGKTSPESR
jgi:hypothetical protein